MTVVQRIVAGALSLLVMSLVVWLVTRRRLREEYAILWLGAGLLLIVTVVFSGIITWTAKLLQIEHPAYGLFVLALFVGLGLAIHFTVVLSKLTAQNWRLTQEVALLTTRLARDEETWGSAAEHRSDSRQSGPGA